MKILHLQPGTALSTLFAIEEHFKATAEPIIIVVAHHGTEGRIEVTGLPYFDEHGNVDVPFKAIDKLERRVVLEIEALHDIPDFKYEFTNWKRPKNEFHVPNAHKNKFNKTNKAIPVKQIRNRSNC